ncbi:DUF748 domain-containing protein [Arenimonas terrae]|uniref:DUF748 domain-containing protein n=1 Tax=Arenimonas terrae TaxID=2546226 RepID=A0A5C4RPX1_9GAMM|nr:DUF748 domain-containing protein [Arenimonas terrae]TNJ32687.1 DUF748 domain-containing protein [Arenimonas terrae]
MPPWLKRKRVWIPAALALALLVYAALGFWWAPRLVREAIVERGGAALGVPVAVGEVQVHPFTFELTVRDLVVADPQQPLLALERLYLDFELASLWRGAWTFETVRLVGPFARAIVRPDGSLNLADLVPPSPPQVQDEPLPALDIGRLIVSRGRINFADRSRRQQPEKVLAPVQFELAGFRTTPEGGGFTLSAASEAGERFDWTGRLSLAPVASQGEFRIRALEARGLWEFLSEQLPFEFGGGEFDLAGTYDFSLDGGTRFEASLPAIQGRDLALREVGGRDDWVAVPRLTAEGTRLSWTTGRIEMAAFTLDGMQVQAWREADGGFNLARLFGGEAVPEASAAAPKAAVAVDADPAVARTPGEAVQAAAPEWTLRLQRFAITGARLDVEDRAVSPAVRFDLQPVSLTATGLSLALDQPLPVTLQATLDGTTTLAGEGQLTLSPLSADLQLALTGLALPKLQPYLADVAAVDLDSGTLAARGQLVLAPPQAAPWLSFRGEAAVDGLRAVDRAQKQELVSWQRLELAGLDYTMAPDALHVRSLTARRPFLRAVIAPDQSFNIARVMSPDAGGASLPAVAVPTAAPTTAPAMSVRVDELRLVAGTLSFADQFIQPNFQAHIESLDGRIRGLSSAPDRRAQVDLAGFVVNKFSPVTIRGELNPFRYDQHTDLTLAFRNIDLPVFNPYSGRYAGFAIAKGKLSTELQYRIRDRQLEAGHHVVLDQLEWGDATDSQDKVSLPIRLATSLLKNRDGVIDLDLPVTGSLDDPKFRVGPVVWQVVKNLVVKIVTAPFAFLGSLFEGAEDAQFVVFAPGDGALSPEQAQALAALAKGLAERPQLRIEVPAGGVPALDAQALAQRRLDAALAALAKVPEGEVFALDGLEPGARVDLLRDLYKQRFDQRAKIPDPAEPPAEADRAARKALREAHEQAWLSAELLAKFAPAEAEVSALAQSRALAIQEALLAGGELDPTRVFVTGVKPLDAKDGQVSIELALE